MQKYECVFILKADLPEPEMAVRVDRVSGLVAEHKGEVTLKDRWGLRRFEYEIDHMTEGFYYVIYFEASREALDEVTRVLGITDAVVRYMHVRLDDELAAVGSAPAAEPAPEE